MLENQITNQQKFFEQFSTQTHKLELSNKLFDYWLKEQREKILEITSKHGACNVRVFGSVARKEADENSDLDLLVDLGENLGAWFPIGLINELENFLGVKVDIVTINGLKERIRDNVLREAIPL